MRVRDLVAWADSVAPFRLAESWDNVGLQIGDPGRTVGKVLLALEVSDAVLDEASALEADTLLLHHPIIFSPLKNLCEDNLIGRYVSRLVREERNAIVWHTNLDSVQDGTNGEIADRIDLRHREFLIAGPVENSNVKFVVFVPMSHIEPVIEAINQAGAGGIGNYSHCTFRAPGTGTFKPLDGANPFAGSIGEIEQATDEVRLECLCPRKNLRALIRSVEQTHPYEEVAWDVYPVETKKEVTSGLGLVGDLPEVVELGDFAQKSKGLFQTNSIGLVGEQSRTIRRVAICSGSGGSTLDAAISANADLLITGEMNHHACAEARDRGLAVILIGHHASEVIVAERMAKQLRSYKPIIDAAVDVVVSSTEVPPVDRV